MCRLNLGHYNKFRGDAVDVQLKIQDNQTGVVYDASSLLIQATWSGEVTGQPGRLEFELVRDGVLQFYEGSRIILQADGQDLFFGWVFSKSRKDNHTTKVIAYDQLRYLKNTDCYGFAQMTASDIFAKICADFQLRNHVVHSSQFVLPQKLYKDKTLANIIQDSMQLTLIHTQKWYMIRDNFGTLEFLDMSQLKTDLLLGDASLLLGYQYQTSIDDDTYNQVKLVKDNPDTGRRDVHLVLDSQTIDRWGLLQYYERVVETANEAQIAQRAAQLMQQKNRVTRKLTLECLGDWRVMPGNGIWVETALDDMILSRYMVVHGCSHTIKNKEHTMKVSLEVVE